MNWTVSLGSSLTVQSTVYTLFSIYVNSPNACIVSTQYPCVFVVILNF